MNAPPTPAPDGLSATKQWVARAGAAVLPIPRCGPRRCNRCGSGVIGQQVRTTWAGSAQAGRRIGVSVPHSQDVTVSTRSTLLEEVTMANKDKGGSKSSKTAASKSLKEKREAKKAKAAGSGSSSSANWTKK